MAITVTGKLNKAGNERATNSGDAMFLVSIGKKERDRQAKDDVWVNYQAALFAKQGPQADFYRKALQQGAIISVSGTGLLPRIWGDNNDQVSLSIQDSKLEGSWFTDTPQAPQQHTYQNAPQAQPQAQSYQAPADEFSDIPFSNYQLKTLV
jgi:single-strand DNA-binding protein